MLIVILRHIEQAKYRFHKYGDVSVFAAARPVRTGIIWSTAKAVGKELSLRRGTGDPRSTSAAVLTQDAVDLCPVFFRGIDPNSRHSEQFLYGSRAAGR
jgi:hypothetical protein